MPDILAMSDEEFLKLNEPPKPEASGGSEGGEGAQLSAEDQAAADKAAQEAADAAAAEQAQKDEEAAAATEAAKDTSNSDTVTKDGEQANNGEQPSGADPAAGQAAKDDAGKEVKDEAAAVVPGSEGGEVVSPPDYEGFYKQIMTPIKANGKTIQLKDPAEAIQLMQMGANYTRKMQALAPQRKLLMMLENNGMLDESQLAFAIDLVKKKDPQAIKKLLKDSGVDPLEIDTNVESTYREGNHRVSDEEATFVSTLDDLQSTQGGTETLKLINTQWDQASKDVLWKDPSVMGVIHEQRVSGVYDRVTAEVERQKTLGTIPAQVPFLHAYKAVGEQMGKAGLLADLVPATRVEPAKKEATPLATTTAKPKPAVKNGAAARAASATPSTPKTAAVKINPLSMSDEDFMKQMASRL